MTLAEAFETSRVEIAAQVRQAAEREALRADEPLSLATTVQIRDNGSVTLRQPNETVTLTASQVAYLMERVGAGVRAS